MKILYIMRHAKSSWKDPILDDHRRPLKKRGQRDAVEMGRRLSARAVRPDCIFSSDARRAMDTAVAVTRALGIDPDQIRPRPELYHATADALRHFVRHLSDRWTRVMLFGHNPTLTDFVNPFLDSPMANLPTAGLVQLDFDCPAWQDVDPRNVTGRYIDFPKKECA